jgi:hypothetical protein
MGIEAFVHEDSFDGEFMGGVLQAPHLKIFGF